MSFDGWDISFMSCVLMGEVVQQMSGVVMMNNCILDRRIMDGIIILFMFGTSSKFAYGE